MLRSAVQQHQAPVCKTSSLKNEPVFPTLVGNKGLIHKNPLARDPGADNSWSLSHLTHLSQDIFETIHSQHAQFVYDYSHNCWSHSGKAMVPFVPDNSTIPPFDHIRAAGIL